MKRISGKRRVIARASQSADRNRAVARPSDFVGHLRRIARQTPGVAVVPYWRVSTEDQVRDGKDVDQHQKLLRKLGQLDVRVVAFGDGGHEPGWALWKSGRPHFMKAVALAKKHGAVIAAMDSHRFIRNRNIKRDRKSPTVADYEDLMQLADGVKLTTIIRPDAPEKSVKSSETKRGLRLRKAGYKKRRKAKILQLVLWLHHRPAAVRGRALARHVGVPESSLRRWIAEYSDYDFED